MLPFEIIELILSYTDPNIIRTVLSLNQELETFCYKFKIPYQYQFGIGYPNLFRKDTGRYILGNLVLEPSIKIKNIIDLGFKWIVLDKDGTIHNSPLSHKFKHVTAFFTGYGIDMNNDLYQLSFPPCILSDKINHFNVDVVKMISRPELFFLKANGSVEMIVDTFPKLSHTTIDIDKFIVDISYANSTSRDIFMLDIEGNVWLYETNKVSQVDIDCVIELGNDGSFLCEDGSVWLYIEDTLVLTPMKNIIVISEVYHMHQKLWVCGVDMNGNLVEYDLDSKSMTITPIEV